MTKVKFPQHIRSLRPEDTERVIEIDSHYALRSRRGFFEKRLEAALEHPKDYVFVGYEGLNKLQGFVLASIQNGEFGQPQTIALLDAIGVDPQNRNVGVGRALLSGIDAVLREKGVKSIVTQADWRNSLMTQFLAAVGFDLAHRTMLERDLSQPVDREIEEEKNGPETDYSDKQSDASNSLARDLVPCRSMTEGDLPALIKIAKAVDGGDYTEFLSQKIDTALHQSGIRVSLVAELDGQVVGMIIARVDFGEFGRMEPAAVIDTIGVHPDYGDRHVGSALLTQLLANLGTLRIDVVRTEIFWDSFNLLRFFKAKGFRPSQTLSFVRRVF